MDHSLDDPLNLDSAMGVDFESHGDQVVSQADISLDAGSHETSIPMEFEPIEEQPLLGSENEQIIGYSDDQFSLQEYVQQQEEDMGANTTVVTSEPSMSQSQSDTMLDIQFDPQSFVSSPMKQESQVLPKIIAVKAAMPPRFTAIKNASMPRQVAIAPKPARAGALKPLSLAPAPRAALVKKVSLSAASGAPAGKTVLAQIGKQLVMVPAGGGQKIKLVATGAPGVHYIRANSEQAQMIATKTISGGSKPMLTKFIVQGNQSSVLNQPSRPAGQSADANQPAVITKLVGAPAPARFVTMTQKTVPISMPNKVLISSPTKQTVRITKKHPFIEIKSPPPKPISTVQTGGTKKVVITAAPAQNLIFKTASALKTPQQVSKEGNITIQSTGQRTQLHQINVPGKGIQYIRLVTNSTAPRLKPVPRPIPGPGKTIVLTDAKGNVIQMAAEKVQSGQPPPLVISGTASTAKLKSVVESMSERGVGSIRVARAETDAAARAAPAPRPPQKLVRIAPVGSKPAIAAAQSMARSAQSLLAPRAAEPEPESDNKAALRALLASADLAPPPEPEPPADPELPHFERRQSSEERSSPRSAEPDPERYREALDQPLIVVSDYLKPREPTEEEAQRYNNFEAQSFNSYQAPTTPQALSENELVPTELGLRPRKACNCTKSQCLKLYCDCFANGEFCNRCNCNNCHNNLENEELRQKAIRGCLDRNPNAFRPKIGKAKSGGPEIVRRHNKGCNCKRSGCLKNYCECYEAKIACTAMCKCVGCRNVEETLDRRRRDARDPRDLVFRPPALPHINFMTTEVIEAVCQCLVAAAAEPGAGGVDPVRDVLDEFSRCLQDIINAAHHSAPVLDESRA